MAILWGDEDEEPLEAIIADIRVLVEQSRWRNEPADLRRLRVLKGDR